MYTSRQRKRLIAFFSCCLLCLLSACASSPAATSTSQTPNAHDTEVSQVRHDTPTITTTTTPQTVSQTACPAAGNGRAMVTTPLVQGSHPVIVYSVNELTGDQQHTVSMGLLKLYDVTSGSKKVIVSIPNMSIGGAEISPDGQWILFTSQSNVVDVNQTNAHGTYSLQVVRLDGRELQTLYCGTYSNFATTNRFQWSPDQKFIAFNSDTFDTNGGGTYTIQLLNIATGSLQSAFSFSTPGATSINFHSWLDGTHLFLNTSGPDGLVANIYVLDTSKGANQQQSDLITTLNGEYNSFESSYNRSQVYIDHNGCGQVGCRPPSSIITLPALGGAPQTLWQSAKYNVTKACAVNDHQLLAQTQIYQSPGSSDPSNGIWVINTNGTSMTRLTTDSQTTSDFINDCAYPWNNASRDGSMYALQINNQQQSSSLVFGKLDGSGSPISFASGSSTLSLSMVGWSTM